MEQEASDAGTVWHRVAPCGTEGLQEDSEREFGVEANNPGGGDSLWGSVQSKTKRLHPVRAPLQT